MAGSDASTANPWAPRHWPTWAVVGLFRLAALLPHPWLMGLGRAVGTLMRLQLRRQRCIAETNLELCFPDRDGAQRARMLRDCFHAIGTMLCEMPLAWWGSDARLARLVEVEGLEHLRGALASGQGVILLAAHFTTLEISGRFINQLHPLGVSYRADRNPVFNRLSYRGRRRHYRRVTSRDDVRSLIRELKSGTTLWFAPDENFPRDNRVIADFMGVPAATNPATARFARLGNARVIPHAVFRRADGRGYRLVFLPPLEDFPSNDAVADTRRVNDALSELVAMAPEQYLWIQKRFLHGASGQLDTYDRCR